MECSSLSPPPPPPSLLNVTHQSSTHGVEIIDVVRLQSGVEETNL